MRLGVGIALVGCLVAPIVAGPVRAESALDLPTRPGQFVRMLVDRAPPPPPPPPTRFKIKPKPSISGTVILLAGGHGNLALGTDGRIGWGAGNQLVRSRGLYRAAGYSTIVPDIAGDLKQGNEGKPSYRWSAEHAADLAAVIAYARSLSEPVFLVGTSRAALSVANVATRYTTGPERPDRLVITAGMLMFANPNQPSVERQVPGLENITQSVLLLNHSDDRCPVTLAASAESFKAKLTGTRAVSVRTLDGGDAGAPDADQCGAASHHGFLGQDEQVAAALTSWFSAPRPKPKRRFGSQPSQPIPRLTR
jgi:hypothetical protein